MIETALATGLLQVNCYILGCEDTRESVVIDPGGDAGEIASVLRENGLSLKKILLTHGHWDHCGALADLKKMYDCRALLHADDHNLYAKATAYAELFGFEMNDPPSLDGKLEGGQKIEVGTLILEVIHTPGHTKGSVTFGLHDRLYTGDLIFAGGVGRTDLPGGSMQALGNSIREEILTYPDETLIFPGHGPRTTVGEERGNMGVWA